MASGTEVGTAYVSIVPSAAGFGAKLEQQITGQAGLTGQKAGQALGAGITGQASGIATKVAGVFAAVGAARFLKGAVAEAEDAARVGRLTDAVISRRAVPPMSPPPRWRNWPGPCRRWRRSTTR